MNKLFYIHIFIYSYIILYSASSIKWWRAISDQCGHAEPISDLNLMPTRRYKTEMSHFMSSEWFRIRMDKCALGAVRGQTVIAQWEGRRIEINDRGVWRGSKYPSVVVASPRAKRFSSTRCSDIAATPQLIDAASIRIQPRLWGWRIRGMPCVPALICTCDYD